MCSCLRSKLQNSLVFGQFSIGFANQYRKFKFVDAVWQSKWTFYVTNRNIWSSDSRTIAIRFNQNAEARIKEFIIDWDYFLGIEISFEKKRNIYIPFFFNIQVHCQTDRSIRSSHISNENSSLIDKSCNRLMDFKDNQRHSKNSAIEI